MLISMCVLGLMAENNGGGGLSRIYGMSRNAGFSYSKYRIKKTLEDLASIGAITKTDKSYMLTLLGANLVAADICAANGYEVIPEEAVRTSHFMPNYQKGII